MNNLRKLLLALLITIAGVLLVFFVLCWTGQLKFCNKMPSAGIKIAVEKKDQANVDVVLALGRLSSRVAEIEAWPADSVASTEYALKEMDMVHNTTLNLRFSRQFYSNADEMFSKAKLDLYTAAKIMELVKFYKSSIDDDSREAFGSVEVYLLNYSASVFIGGDEQYRFRAKLEKRRVDWPAEWPRNWFPRSTFVRH